MARTLWADPTPATAAVDLTPVTDAIAQIKADDVTDDATVAALEVLVKAIPTPPDLSIYPTKTALDAEVAARAAADRTLNTQITSLTQTIANNGTDIEDRVASAEFNIDNLATNLTTINAAHTETERLVGINIREFNTRLNGAESTMANRDDVAAIATRVTAVEAKNTGQDTAIALRALKTDIPSVNLADWTNTGGNTVLNILVPNRAGAKLDTLSFRLFDRRGGNLATRTKNITVSASSFSYSTGSGWTGWWDASYPAAIWQDVTMPDNSVYRIYLHFMTVPNGLAIMFRDNHSSTDNSYGAFDTIKATYVKS